MEKKRKCPINQPKIYPPAEPIYPPAEPINPPAEPKNDNHQSRSGCLWTFIISIVFALVSFYFNTLVKTATRVQLQQTQTEQSYNLPTAEQDAP